MPHHNDEETVMQTEDVNGNILETWSVEEVAEAWAEDRVVLIDVRTPQEYMFEHVGGALLLPVPFFDPSKLPGQSEKRIVLMCGSGARSGKMARMALEAGFERIAHMDGGFTGWKKAEKPYVGTDMSTGAPKEVNR